MTSRAKVSHLPQCSNQATGDDPQAQDEPKACQNIPSPDPHRQNDHQAEGDGWQTPVEDRREQVLHAEGAGKIKIRPPRGRSRVPR
jgi:hypothetical protein